MEEEIYKDICTPVDIIESITKELDLLKCKDIADIKTALKIINGKIDKLKFMDTQSPTTGEITKALCAATLERTKLTFSGSGNRSEYATIDDLVGTFDVPLANNGLKMSFMPWETVKGEPFLVTTLSHVSGEWFKSVSRIVPDEAIVKNSGYNQGFKSGTTYAKRNAYEAMMGV